MRESWDKIAEQEGVELWRRNLPTPDRTRIATVWYLRRYVDLSGGERIKLPEEPTFGDEAEAKRAFALAVAEAIREK